jgi:hypothetical protein
MALRDRILTQTKCPARTLTPDGWAEAVEVRGMTGTQRAEFLDFIKRSKGANSEANVDLREFYPLLVLGHVHDPADGSKVFTDSDSGAVMELPGASLEQIAKAVLELSGLDADAEKRARGESSQVNEASTSP